MIQAPEPEGPHYAVRLSRDADAGRRMPRLAQSKAASALLGELRRASAGAAAWSSKAHSRALVAAAVSDAGPIGVDVEYEAPSRDIGAIARFLGAPAPDAAAAYRLFTFREAYFKALGQMPARALLRMAAEACQPTYSTPDGLSVLHERPAQGFFLTLVWAGGGVPVRHELP